MRSGCGVADRCIPCGTLPHRSAVFRVPRILSDARAARLRVRLTAAAAGCGSSTPGLSSAADLVRLSTVEVVPVRSPARWSRSRTVFLFSPFGAESPFCVHSRLSLHGSRLCSSTLRCSSALAAMLTSRRSRLLHDHPPCDGRRACIRVRLAMSTCASSRPLTLRCSSSFHVRVQPRPLIATFHVRSPHGARTLPSSMFDLSGAHVFCAPPTPCDAVDTRIRDHLAAFVFALACMSRLSAFRCMRGTRLCFTPLAFALSSSCFGAHARSRLSTLASLRRRVPTFHLRSLFAGVVLAFSVLEKRARLSALTSLVHVRFPPSSLHPLRPCSCPPRDEHDHVHFA